MTKHESAHGLTTALARVELFADLDDRELAAVGEVCRREHSPAGAEIVREGDRTGRFYLIHAGEVDVVAGGEVVARLKADDYFGEIAVIDQNERSATIRASTDVELSSLAAFNCRALLREHPEITYKLLLRLCARLRRAEGHAVTS